MNNMDEVLKRIDAFISSTESNGHSLKALNQKVDDMREYEEDQFEDIKGKLKDLNGDVRQNKEDIDRFKGSFKVICWIIGIIGSIVSAIVIALILKSI